MEESLVMIDGVYKIFKGTVDTVALDNISYEFPRGEFIAIYGPSGSGKSTLLKCIGDIWRPSTGRIFFEKKNVTRLSDTESSHYRINDVGFIFQEFNLIPSLSVSQNIDLPLQLAGKYSFRERKDQIQELLEKFGISRYIDSGIDELSGGEQQRVAICVALATDPSLILADEPTANLDSDNRTIVLEHLRDLTRENKTVIVATHDPEVQNYTTKILKLDKGKIVK